MITLSPMVIRSHHPDSIHLNPALLIAISSHRQLYPGSQLGVGQGWSGPKTLFDIPSTYSLVSFIKSLVHLPCNLVGWANYMKPNEFIGEHNHDDGKNFMSGVYYLSPAALKLEDAGRGWPDTIEFQPGDLVMFPSTLKHCVTPCSAIRISIAFNAVLK